MCAINITTCDAMICNDMIPMMLQPGAARPVQIGTATAGRGGYARRSHPLATTYSLWLGKFVGKGGLP